MNLIQIGSYQVISCNYPSSVEMIIHSILNNEKIIFSHINLYNFYLLKKFSEDDNLLLYPGIYFFEGIGLKIIMLLFGKKFKHDINGTDLYPVLFKKLIENRLSVFLVGSTNEVIEKVNSNLNKDYPALLIKNYQAGYFTIDEENNVIAEINESSPDLLILGMGMDKELAFISRHYNELKVKAIWNVGGLFDFISGTKPRAPKILRIIRFEWLFRFMLDPGHKFFRNFFVPFWFIFHYTLIKIKKNL